MTLSEPLTNEELAAIEELAEAATLGPRFVRHLDDDHAMSLVAISTAPDAGRGERWSDFDHREIVAAPMTADAPARARLGGPEGPGRRPSGFPRQILHRRLALPGILSWWAGIRDLLSRSRPPPLGKRAGSCGHTSTTWPAGTTAARRPQMRSPRP
jgi:hypothetical protein